MIGSTRHHAGLRRSIEREMARRDVHQSHAYKARDDRAAATAWQLRPRPAPKPQSGSEA